MHSFQLPSNKLWYLTSYVYQIPSLFEKWQYPAWIKSKGINFLILLLPSDFNSCQREQIPWRDTNLLRIANIKKEAIIYSLSSKEYIMNKHIYIVCSKLLNYAIKQYYVKYVKQKYAIIWKSEYWMTLQIEKPLRIWATINNLDKYDGSAVIKYETKDNIVVNSVHGVNVTVERGRSLWIGCRP